MKIGVRPEAGLSVRDPSLLYLFIILATVCQEMAFILFDFEESNTVVVFTCSGVLPMIANARITV